MGTLFLDPEFKLDSEIKLDPEFKYQLSENCTLQNKSIIVNSDEFEKLIERESNILVIKAGNYNDTIKLYSTLIGKNAAIDRINNRTIVSIVFYTGIESKLI